MDANSDEMKNIDLYEDGSIINERFKDTVFDEKISVLILEQWKACVDCSKEISSRRLSMNGLFLTGLSLLVGGITFGNGLAGFTMFQRDIVIFSICTIGIILCRLWVNQLSYYSSLNDEKYNIIRELENYLPAFVFQKEYKLFYCKGKSFSRIEKYIPMSFAVFFLIAIVVVSTPYLRKLIELIK